MGDLDELLQSIQEEAKRESAISLYEGTRQDDLVDKEVDERILRLLGLEEVFDIDYATYLTLLKERMVAARMADAQIPTEEAELLTNEFRTVKSKVGRFKIKKKKVSFDGTGGGGATAAISPSRLMLPGGVSESDKTSSVDAALLNKLDELLSVIKQDLKLDKEEEKRKKVTAENLRRRGSEDKLEDGNKASKFLKGAAKKAFAPFESILDKVLKFLGFTALGFVFDKFYKWWTNPENQKKVELLGTFLKDWWPALSAAALLFLTPFGAFVRGTIRLLRTQLPRLLRLIARNPLATVALLGAAGATTSAIKVEQRRERLDKEDDASVVTPKEFLEEKQTPGYGQLMDESILQRGFGGGGFGAFSQGGVISQYPQYKFRNRGILAATQGAKITTNSGQEITGAGVDTQLIAAQPGEMIMPVSTVNQYGANYFMDLIRSSGKTGKPKMVNNIQFAKSGGMVGNVVNNIQSMQSGGMVGNIVNALSFLPGTGTVMAPMASQGTYQDEGTVMSKFLGMNVPGSLRRQKYSDMDVQRYNRSDTGDPTRFLEKFSAQDTRSDSLNKIYGKFGQVPTSPAVRSNRRAVPALQMSESDRNKKFIGESFKNLPQNINTLKSAAQRQREMLNQIMPGRFEGSMNMRGQPLNMGPQSSIAPVGTPVVSSETKMIVLPPQTTVAKKPDIPVKEGSDIPQFDIIASSGGRSRVISALGISDLVGA